MTRLNDPFGRLQRRDEAGYATVKAALVRAGVRDREAVERAIARTRARVAVFIAVVGAVLVPAAALWPRAAPVTLALGVLLVAFAVNSLIKGTRHFKRYIDEELDAP
jgi:hypothetical protein